MHPIDRYLYFNPLVESVLNSHNCTVCYLDSPLDSKTYNLDEIDILIIGITEKYITWNNSGFISEALPAINKGIPVLPVMLESGIVNLFNTRCGKLHYIENIGESFSKESLLKINNHIAAVFSDKSSDEDEKPKIFISYRKCDSELLIRLADNIKSHSKGNKVSLWYDQSLNPGDNYSTTIIEQIEKCDLFLMLITPNILEPNNYVMRIEYPLAVKRKKQIIPIVMQKTDLKRLSELYPDIPKYITRTQIGGIFSKIKMK